MTNTSIVILAAGLGTRMRSKFAKVLHRAGGVSLVEHVVTAALDLASPDDVVVVTGHQAEAVETILAPSHVRFARQPEPKGTGHALLCARPALTQPSGMLMVLYGDTPLLTADTLALLRDIHISSNAAATVITTTLTDPAGYGRVVIDPADGGRITAIVEHAVCTTEQLAIREINSGIYCFDIGILWAHADEIQPNNPKGEYYLTDMVDILTRHGHRVQALNISESSELLGINTRIELAEADRILRRRKSDAMMLAGVTVEKPETVAIDMQVTAGIDTVVEPFVRLLGTTTIGEDCLIGTGSILENATLGDRVVIKPYSLIADSRIDAAAQIGPFSRLRMNAEIGEDARIGNFVEVKKSRVGKGTKAQHLAYLGDATVGDRVNVGAGSVTCNYDGKNKHQTKIGDGAFIGSNSTLIAPMEIGGGSYIAAASVITDPVPSDALAIGRGRQVNKPGWTRKPRP